MIWALPGYVHSPSPILPRISAIQKSFLLLAIWLRVQGKQEVLEFRDKIIGAQVVTPEPRSGF